jgi:hypothetical protein
MTAPGTPFTPSEIQNALDLNAADVVRRWRSEFASRPPHWMCENCGFVSDDRGDFEVDHILPQARGGTGNVVSQSQGQEIGAGSLETLYQVGDNRMVLCGGCNQAKKARQFIPPGAGYAYRFPERNRNPDHLYYGRPTVERKEREEHPELYSPKRYGH